MKVKTHLNQVAGSPVASVSQSKSPFWVANSQYRLRNVLRSVRPASAAMSLLEAVSVLGTTLTVTWLTEILELLAIPIPAVSVFVVLTGVPSTEGVTAGDTRHLLV